MSRVLEGLTEGSPGCSLHLGWCVRVGSQLSPLSLWVFLWLVGFYHLPGGRAEGSSMSAWSRVVLTAVAGVLVRRGIFWRERRDIHWGSPVLAQAETGERQPQARGP